MPKSRDIDFAKHATTYDGLRPACKNCNNLANRLYAKTEQGRCLALLRVKRWQKTEKGRAAQRRASTSQKGLASRKKHVQSIKGKETRKRYHDSDKGLSAHLRYRESEAGKIVRQLYNELPHVQLRNRIRMQEQRGQNR